MRRCADGEVEIKRIGSVRRTVERNAQMQKDSKGKPSMFETKGEFMRMVASMPEDAAMEMHEKCGSDSDKRLAFLRDNPQWLVTHPKNAGLPKKKIYIYPR